MRTRVNYRCSDIMHVRTPYLEAGSSDRGRGYAKWYLGVNSHHISSESSCKQINPARGSQEREFRKLLCSDVCIHFRPVHAQAAIPELFSSRFDIVIAPPQGRSQDFMEGGAGYKQCARARAKILGNHAH